MRALDRFFDTYPKRMMMLYSLLVICLLYFGYQNCVLGSYLNSISQFNDVYVLLESGQANATLVGRGILAFLNYVNTDFGMVKVIWNFFDIQHLFVLVLVVLYLGNGLQLRVFKWSRNHLLCTLMVQILVLIFVFAVGGIALQSGTTEIALSLLHTVGIWYYGIQMVLIVAHICCYFMFMYHFDANAM